MMYFKLLSLIFLLLSTASFQLDARSRLKGTVSFGALAHTSGLMPHSPRIYYRGTIIPTYSYGTLLSGVTFDIPKNNSQTRFYLLIVEEFSKKYKDAIEENGYRNTIDYLHVPKKCPYKFFVLDLVPDEQDTQDQSIEALLKTQQKTYHWNITEETLPEEGNFPDSTIIICYLPEMLKEIKGGSLFDLPTISFNCEQLAHNDTQDIQDALLRLQLAAIDTDTIHAPIKRKIETKDNRLLIMDIA